MQSNKKHYKQAGLLKKGISKGKRYERNAKDVVMDAEDIIYDRAGKDKKFDADDDQDGE